MASSKQNVIRLPGLPALSWDDCRLLVGSVLDYAIFMLDTDGNVVTWNPGAERLKGYEADEIIGQHFSKFYPPEDIAEKKPERELEIAIAEGRVEDEGWRVRKDGTRFWANVVITALRDERGRLRGFGKVTRDLSDRRKTEEELRRSEERFRLLLENVSDYAIYMLDLEGRVTTWNLGAERMKGYTADEIVGKPFRVFFTPEDIAAGKPERELEAAREVGRHEDEGWRLRKDGTRFWANAILTGLRDPHGELIGYAKITRDLTARREADEKSKELIRAQAAREAAEQAERQLRASEARYRALSHRLEVVFEGVADGITVQDRSGRIVLANSAGAHICGFDTVDELVRTSPAEVLERFDIFDEDGRPFPLDKLPGRRVLAGEKLATALLQVKHRRTRRQWWSLVRATAVEALDGTHDLAVNIWHDVTEHHREEQQAKVLADATAALGTSLDERQMLATLAGVLVPGLGDWCSVHLLHGDELRCMALAHVDPAKVAAAEEYERRFPPRSTQTSGAWNVVRTARTEVYNDVTDATLEGAITDPERLAYVATVGLKAALIVPITVRSRVLGVLSLAATESERHYEAADVALVEELARRAGTALENAQLYAAAQDAARAAEEASRAKDEFLATVSHELRTPLNAILGWSSILQEKVAELPAFAKPVAVIHRNAQAQVKIIDDILDVSRVITGKFRLEPKPADLVAIARDAVEVVRASAIAKRITIELAADAEYILFVADAERLQQVIWNLLSNAVKFTDGGGRIRLRVAQEGSQVTITVSDTGRGIAPDFLPYVFERFKQADSSTTRRVGGLGLGLALVRHIVELHGGHVAAESPGLGKGATFTVTLPVRAVAPTATDMPRSSRLPAAPPAGALAATLTGIRVLVVDDEPDARELVQTVLADAGAIVETACSAADGFARFRQSRPHVLVSDVGMPDEDGFSFIRRIRSLPPSEGGRAPSLALTAFAREEDRTRAISAGFTTHIGKPVDPEALVAAVANLASVATPS